MRNINVVDLFCGGGGGSIGIHRNDGFNTVFALDFWNIATDTYKHNFPDINVICDDIHNLTETKIKELVGDNKIDIVIGGPPCQGFSMVARNKFNTYETSKIDKGDKIINEIENAYEMIGYHLKYKVVDIQKLGLPQKRKRVIFIASYDKELVDKFIYPDETTNINVSIKDAISDLEYDYTQNEFIYTKNFDDVSDYVKTLRDKNKTMYQDLFHKAKDSILHRNRCNQIKNGEYMFLLNKNNPYKIKSKYTNSYERKYYDDKLSTMTNVIKTMFIHPKFDRCYSLRESARLQNFPDSYKFLINKYSQTHHYQILCNAIPPILTEYIFKEIKRIW